MSYSGLKSVQKPSSIEFCPSSEDSSASYHLIFFITGNPGLISYYNVFLDTLNHLLLDSSNQSHSDLFHIYGQSLAGFEQDDQPPETTSVPYSLEDQIKIILQSLTDQRIRTGPRRGQPYDSIILIGHSVGTYILLETLQRLRTSSSPIKVKACILLFATVTHIAQSPSGVKLSSLFRIPGFPRGASIAAKALLWVLPRPTLKWLIGLVTGMPDDAAEVTTRFLTSNMGIWQALHLAKDEMESITEDKWDEEIWGVEHEDATGKVDIPRLIFYFGANDHWVANHTRDALIAARGKGEGEVWSSRPIMLIDDKGIDHSFCIRDSERIAETVKLWIDDIIYPERQL